MNTSWGAKIIQKSFALVLVMSFIVTSPRTTAFAEDEGGGSKAAEILFGLAAMIAAAAPMVAAAIQADADKKIAKINANAQMTMTKMSADTSKALADQQKEIALTQAQIAADISQQNQQSTTQRLTMQLSELRAARQDANAVEEKKRLYQQEVEQKRIALAEKQADETVRLANVQMRAQLMASGSSQGFSRTINSAASTTRYGSPSNLTASVSGSSANTLSSSVGNGTGGTSGLGVTSRTSNSNGGELASLGSAGTGTSSARNRSRGVIATGLATGDVEVESDSVKLFAAETGKGNITEGAIAVSASANPIEEFEKGLLEGQVKKRPLPISGPGLKKAPAARGLASRP